MRLDFDTDQKAVRDAIAAALKSATGDRLRDVWGRGYLDMEYRALGEMGMFGFAAGEPPEESGGSPVETCILAEQLGRHAAPTPVLTSVVQSAGALRGAGGRSADYASLVEGRSIWSWAHLEAASRPGGLPGLRASAAGRRGRLSGEKSFVEWASLADAFVVTAIAGGEPIVVVVPRDADGVTVRRRHTNTGGEIAHVTFERTPIEGDAVIALGPDAESVLLDTARRTLLFQSAYLAGVGRRAIDLTIAHAKIREQFGRPIGAFQAVKHALADAHIALLAAWLMVFETASRGVPSTSLANLASTKAWVAEATTQALRVAHEIHGGLGAVDNHEVSLLFRRALGETHMFGSPAELWELAAGKRADHGTGARRPAS